MGTKIKPFNPVYYLNTDREIAEFLAEAYEDEDPAVFITALGHVVRHKGYAHMAEVTGLNRERLYKTFNGKRQPKWDTVHRLLHALGVDLTVAA